MKKYNLILFLFSIILMLSACREDSIDTDIVKNIPEPEVTVESEITGRIIDGNGEPISGANIAMGQQVKTSDENGIFKITSEVDEKRALLKIEKSGYFNAFPVVRPSKEAAKFITIQMTEKQVLTSFSALQGGTASLNNGTQTTFAPNSFINKSTGEAYTGAVNIFATYIDPTVEDLYEIMPGNLTAINTQNEEVGLKSYGMFNLELEDDAGNALQINQNATITVRVPDELLNQAPPSIPLWYFDENSGLWIEEGSATLQGNTYIGEVAHFTPWNCDDPFSVIDLSGQVLINTKPTNTVYVRITRLSDGTNGNLYLDDLGNFEDVVPSDELLLLEVIDECGEVIHSENVGPFASDTQLETINVTVDDNIYSLVSGNIVDCEGNALANGYAKVDFVDNKIHYIHTDESGAFSKLVANCGATNVEVSASDIENFVTGDVIPFSVTQIIDAGTLIACGNILEGEFARFNSNDGEVILGTPDCSTYLNNENLSITFELEYNGDISIITIMRNSLTSDLTGITSINTVDVIYLLPDVELIEEGNEVGELINFKIHNFVYDVDVWPNQIIGTLEVRAIID